MFDAQKAFVPDGYMGASTLGTSTSNMSDMSGSERKQPVQNYPFTWFYPFCDTRYGNQKLVMFSLKPVTQNAHVS